MIKSTRSPFFLKYFLPAILLIFCAFWVGTLPNLIFSLVGFLSFFVAGVTLMVEGWKKRDKARGA